MIEAGEGASRQGRGRARGRNSAGHRLSNPGGEGVREDEDIREEVDEEGPIPELIPVGSDSDDDDDEEEGVGNEEEEGGEEEDEDLRQRLMRL